jgi:hypothetical protein
VLALQQAMAVQPANPVLPLFLGRIYADHADYTHAAHWCARALALNPANCQALALQALIKVASGQPQQGSERLLQPLPLPVSTLQRAVLWCSRSRVPSLLQQANAAMQGRVLLQVEALLLQHAAPARTLAQQLLDTTALHADATVAERLLSGLDRLLTRVIVSIRRWSMTLRYAFQPATRALHQRFLQAEDAAYRTRCMPRWRSSARICRTSRNDYAKCVTRKGSFARLCATCGAFSSSSLTRTNQGAHSTCCSASCVAR